MSDVDNDALGTSMEDIYNGRGPWCFETSPITASRRHAVLYQLPATLKNPPKPHISSRVYHWDNDHVRMPYSSQNLLPTEENGKKGLVERWSIIETALLQPIQSSRQLEAIISSYNTNVPEFISLHNFFEEVLDEEESTLFFRDLLPKIIGLALRLPEIIPGSLPLLKQEQNRSISLSQLQIASLLANAFLCTYPRHEKNAATYPSINFVRLFAAYLRPKYEQIIAEKLKCICHYFRRVTDVEPIGVVTFERQHIPKSQLPDWAHIDRNLGETRLHVSSKGCIEDDGLGLLQVDFANKKVGGGVLGHGCVQEEIRFIICPELIISRLFTEQLGPTEALIIRGAERYSKYEGYGDSFTWEGNFNDTTPHDAWGRRRTTIVAIDAIHFSKTKEQYTSPMMLRELNKAYAGFHLRVENCLPAVATGNWGCGAFQGDPKLKGLLQLMACSASRRDMVYYTFENSDLQQELYKMYAFLVQVKVSQLWKYLIKFSQTNIKPMHLYAYLQQAHLDSKTKPSLKCLFGNINFKKLDKNRPSTSTQNDVTAKIRKDAPTNDTVSSQEIIECLQNVEDIIDTSQWNDIMMIESSEEIVESSQTETTIADRKSIHRSNVNEQNKILHLFDVIDGDTEKQEENHRCESEQNMDESIPVDDDTPEIIEIDVSEPSNRKAMSGDESAPKRKITDYFLKVDKR